METVVTLRCVDSGEEHVQKLYDLQLDGKGRLAWAAVEKAFGADLVEIEGRGTPGLLQEGVCTLAVFAAGLSYSGSSAQGEREQYLIFTQATQQAFSPANHPSAGISQLSNNDAVYCRVKVTGETGYFSGLLLLDTGCSMELNISERKAYQIGLQHAVKLGDSSNSGITLRKPALIQVFLESDENEEPSINPHTAYLEVWTDDGTLGDFQPATRSPLLKIEKEKCSPVSKPGQDRGGFDLKIGRPGMLKLGLGIDARSGRICNRKRHFCCCRSCCVLGAHAVTELYSAS